MPPYPGGVSRHLPIAVLRAPARATFVCGDKSSQKHRLDLRSKNPSRATPVRCRPRFPSRNRRFPDRCRSPDCASTAFRCRCPLLRQKTFVLPCRRLRNNYILCPTGTPTFAAARRQRRDLIIAHLVEANTPTVAEASGRVSLRAGERRHSPFDRQ